MRRDTKEQSDVGVVDYIGSAESFHFRSVFRFDVFAEEFEIFRVDPGMHVALGEDHCAGLLKDTITGDMIDVIVRVDDVLHRQLRQLADFGEQLFGCFGIFERVDHRHAVARR